MMMMKHLVMMIKEIFTAALLNITIVEVNISKRRGLHVVKVDPNGSVDWKGSIESSYYNCRSSSNYCNVLHSEFLFEDEFYVFASTYQHKKPTILW